MTYQTLQLKYRSLKYINSLHTLKPQQEFMTSDPVSLYLNVTAKDNTQYIAPYFHI